MIKVILVFYIATSDMNQEDWDTLKGNVENIRPEDHLYFYVNCPNRNETYVDCVYPKIVSQDEATIINGDLENRFLDLQRTIHEQQNQDNFLTVDKPKQFKISKKKI